MFKYFREEMSSTTTKVVLGLLIISFATWGIHGLTGRNENIIAQANGQSVSKQELARLFQFTIENAPIEFKQAIQNSAELKNATINNLVNGLLFKKTMVAKLEDIGFSYSQSIINDETQSLTKTYNNIEKFIHNYNYTKSELFSELKTNSTLKQLDVALAAITPEWPSLRNLNQKSINVSKTIAITKVTAQTPKATEAELQEYYSKKSNDYMSKPYVVLTEQYFVPPALEPSSTDLIKFYDNHIDWYVKPATIKASIYKIIPKSTTAEQKLDFLAPEQLAELGKNQQELSYQAERTFSETTTEPSLFALLNTINDTEADFAMLDGKEVMVQVHAKQPAITPDFNDIKAKVKADYSKQILNQAKDKVRDAFSNGQVPANNVKVRTAKVIDLNQYNPQITAAWLLNHNNLQQTHVYENANELILVQITEQHPSVKLPLAEVKAKVMADYIASKTKEFTMKKAEKLLTSTTKSGQKYTVDLSSEPIANIAAEKLMQLQFYPNASAKIFPTTNAVFVAHLIDVKQKENVDNNLYRQLLASYGRDPSKIFATMLLAK